MGHVELVVALLVAGVIGFVGYRVLSSSAGSLPALNKHDCTLMGRVWNDNKDTCKKECASGQGSYTVNPKYDYCSKAVSTNISYSKCDSLGRAKLASKDNYIGCARRADQKTTANAPECQGSGRTYTVASPYDKCSVGTSASGPKYEVSCSVGNVPSVMKIGDPVNPKVTVKNTGTAAISPSLRRIVVDLLSNGSQYGDRSVGNFVNVGTISAGSSKTISIGGYWLQDGTSTGSGGQKLIFENDQSTAPYGFECTKTFTYHL